ncbi:DUF86 domain-containing protein [Peribacillus glennii]|uniref:DUF86 domain-containing protein n=1 Tax=Peribacillus glennii TaxID=2303991 RepID=A0A372LDD2_9BACI|nr:DUF86 domain-containing protein [Peribacillus glennii]RFU64002.1 DUF86 domain-containing protein [Peribacillus glennii]
MYFVDRQKIEHILVYLERQMSLFESTTSWDTEISRTAVERIIQTSIDAVLDVGNAMIDGFIMRDPGSFEDIVDILLDEKVIDASVADGFKQALLLRKMLVQEYINISHQDLLGTFTEIQEAFRAYPDLVRRYITNELGPVSAFKN